MKLPTVKHRLVQTKIQEDIVYVPMHTGLGFVIANNSLYHSETLLCETVNMRSVSSCLTPSAKWKSFELSKIKLACCSYASPSRIMLTYCGGSFLSASPMSSRYSRKSNRWEACSSCSPLTGIMASSCHCCHSSPSDTSWRSKKLYL